MNFLGQGNKGGSSRLPLGEERANILLLACCYQEGSNPRPGARGSVFSQIRAARKHFGAWKQIGIKNATLTR